jgi:hypothetical protein
MSQMSLFSQPVKPKPASAPVSDEGHRPKAFYSAAPDGMVTCQRCRELLQRTEVARHTAVCWPECGVTNGR